MNEFIKDDIDYSIKAFEHLNKYRNFLNEKSQQSIKENLLSYNLTQERLDKITKHFKIVNKNRSSIEFFDDIDKAQFDYSFNLFLKSNGKGFDKYFINLKKRARRGDFSQKGKDLDRVLFELSSFRYLTKIFGETTHLTLQIFCKIFAVLNIIEQKNPELSSICSAAKHPFYLQYETIISLANEKNIDMVERSMSLFELLEKDYFNLFFRDEILFSNAFADNFLEYLEEDNYRYSWPISKIETLQLCMLNMNGEFDDEYLALYEKYKPLDINNAYLNIALLAGFLSKKSKLKVTFKHINRDKLVEYNKPYYDALKVAIDSDDIHSFKTQKMSNELIDLLRTQPYEIVKVLIDELNEDYLGKYLIKETIKTILESRDFVINFARFILDCSPNTLSSYIQRSDKFVDIESEVYKFSVELLLVNRFEESGNIAIKLLENMQDDSSISSEVLDVIFEQMKLTFEVLGFRFIKK